LAGVNPGSAAPRGSKTSRIIIKSVRRFLVGTTVVVDAVEVDGRQRLGLGHQRPSLLGLVRRRRLGRLLLPVDHSLEALVVALSLPRVDELFSEGRVLVLGGRGGVVVVVDQVVQGAAELGDRGADAFPDGGGELVFELVDHLFELFEVGGRVGGWVSGKGTAVRGGDDYVPASSPSNQSP